MFSCLEPPKGAEIRKQRLEERRVPNNGRSGVAEKEKSNRNGRTARQKQEETLVDSCREGWNRRVDEQEEEGRNSFSATA